MADEEFEEYESEFEDEAEALNLAIVAFEEELARTSIVRTEMPFTVEGEPSEATTIALIWSAYGKERRPQLLVLLPLHKDVQALRSAPIKVRIAAARLLARFADLVRMRGEAMIDEIRTAREYIAAATRALKVGNDAHS